MKSPKMAPYFCLAFWKSSLLTEIKHLEEDLNQLYSIVGVKTANIVDQHVDQEKLSEAKSGYESIIDHHLTGVQQAATNICSMISGQTEFDLPIPVSVLLRLAAKIGLIRWKDYKKKPNGLLRTYVYSLTPHLIDTNLEMFKSLITVLGTNIIPFISFINQSLLRILEWTRSSNLMKQDENLYHSLRSQVFRMVSFIVEQLSLNINLEPNLLKNLLEVELVDNLESLAESSVASDTQLRDKHAVDALNCLENLIVIYSDYLEVALEKKIKSYVIQACIKIYRDFGASSSTSLDYRRQLLRLLQTVANQPYASSTTEISYHIFELAEKLERDPDIRSVARRSLKIGLAHRPIIVTHHEVYNVHPTTLADFVPELEPEPELVPELVEAPEKAPAQPVQQPATDPEPVPEAAQADPEPMEAETAPVATKPAIEPVSAQEPAVVAETASVPEVAVVVEKAPAPVQQPATEPVSELVAAATTEPMETDTAPAPVQSTTESVQRSEPEKIGQEEQLGDESEVLSCMSYFVEKLA